MFISGILVGAMLGATFGFLLAAIFKAPVYNHVAIDALVRLIATCRPKTNKTKEGKLALAFAAELVQQYKTDTCQAR